MRCGARYRNGYGMQMQAGQAVNSTCTVDKNRTDRRFLLGSFGRRVACWVDAWMRGCVGANQRASERVGLRVLSVLLLYPRARQEKGCSSGSGFLLWVGFEFSGSGSVRCCSVWWWEGQLRLSADVDGMSMTKDPRKRRGLLVVADGWACSTGAGLQELIRSGLRGVCKRGWHPVVG